MPVSRVLIDANVVYSRTLLDWVSLLSLRSNMFEVFWTEDILAEARYHLRKNMPSVSDGYLTARFDRIRAVFPDGRISGFEITHCEHPDPHDWHVVNAAHHGNMGYPITDDQKFETLVDDTDLEFETHTADTFLTLVDDSAAALVRAVAAEQHAYWCARPGSLSLPDALRRAGAPEFADRVQHRLHGLGLSGD